MNINKHIRWVYLFILFCLVFLTSCTSDKEFTYLNDQIVATNKKVTRLQESVDVKLQGDLEARLKSIQTNQAEIGLEIDSLKRRLQELAGRVEESEHIVKRTVETDLSSQDAIRSEVALLVPKVKELEEILKKQQASLDQLADLRVQVEKNLSGGDQKVTKSKELELYDLSYALFKEKKYDQSKASFQRFLDEYPKSDRADNAQFWIGESFMGLKQYDQAILAFQQVIEKYPKGNKVPSAILRQAMAFLEIKDETSSKVLLRKVIKEFPNSEEAKVAQSKLGKME
jgi:tol-pal system protein YbgF